MEFFTEMSTESPFTLSAKEASKFVNNQARRGDNRQCYLMHVSFQTVYGGEHALPQSCFKKLPRLINGIPLGAGKMSSPRPQPIIWRYIEGSRAFHTFLSGPITYDDAEEARKSFKERLLKQAKAVFGDITVKATIVLSQCVYYDEEFFINDIADSMDDTLHFGND